MKGQFEMETKIINMIKKSLPELHASEKIVANYIIKNPQLTIKQNVTTLAEETNVSVATIVRTCKHLGFDGFYQMKLLLSKDIGSHETLNSLTNSKSSKINFIISLNKYIESLFNDNNLDSINKAANIINDSNNIYIIASGNTIPVCLDLEYRLNRLSLKAFTSNSDDRIINYISNSSSKDCIVCISRSGLSKNIHRALKIAESNELKSIIITANTKLPIFKNTDCLIDSSDELNIYISEGTGLVSHTGEYIIVDYMINLIMDKLISDDKLNDLDFNIEINLPNKL